MARYNREFLVPYLRDVCACELLIRKLNDSIRYNQERIQAIERKNYCREPVLQYYEPESYTMDDFLGDVGTISISVVAAVALCLFTGWFQYAWCLAVILSPIILWPALRIIEGKLDRKSCEDQYELDYQEEMQKYNASIRAQQADAPKVAAHQEQINTLTNELRTVNSLMNDVYRANIIPSQYRNIYAAMYLYEWFDTSGSDDLDHALSMFVLEEIKERLDRVIYQQSEIILNQELTHSMLYSSLEEQK